MFNIKEFIILLKKVNKSDLFNPYTDSCIVHDGPNSAEIRTDNLRKYLQLLKTKDTILVGEAPGHKGCRKTGIAFTDEDNLPVTNQILQLDLQLATKTKKSKENSATFMWDVFNKLKNPPLLWNIIPFHPFTPPNGLTNRTPNKSDYEISKEVINYFFKNTEFKQIFAIGKIAQKYLSNLGLNHEIIYIRHPSMGGSTKFKEGIFANFERKSEKKKEKKLSNWL